MNAESEPVGSRTMNAASAYAAVRAAFAASTRTERACYAVAGLLVLAGVAHLGVALVEPRPWGGPLSWRKPVTFGLSFGLTLATITWVTSQLRLPSRARRWILAIFAVDCVVEVAGITVQAWRHVPSHFNTETAVDASIAFTLAWDGAILVVTLGVLAAAAMSRRFAPTEAAMRRAVRVGFGLLLASLASGIAMIAKGSVLVRSGHPDLAYAEAGYLKPFHAVTLHAVLVLPALAAWLSTLPLRESRRRGIVTLSSAGYLTAAAAALAFSLLR
jgi:hypothetical protein